MPWYTGNLPVYLPIADRRRQEPFTKDYPVEVWAYQSLMQDYGEGVKPWVKEAVQTRQLGMHFFVPGTRLDRLWFEQRDLWHKAWREIAKYVQFSFGPEFDVWWDIPLLEGRVLQNRTKELTRDMLSAGLSMIWLMVDIRAGGRRDQQHYCDFANQQHMRWVASNIQGARDKTLFKEMLEVLAVHHRLLHPDIGVVINGVAADKRIRAVLRVFKGRQVVIANSAKIEMTRRAIVARI